MGILFDSDFIISLFVRDQINHKPAKEIINKLAEEDFFILNLTKYEVVTVASRKFSQALAKDILEMISQFNNIYFEPEDEIKTINMFKEIQKKNISFIDCANLVIAKKYNLKIASFDKFYPKETRIG